MVKVEGRGAIAAFSPSGLSLDGPAHQFHRAVMAELVRRGPRAAGRRHPRRAEGLRPDRPHARAALRLPAPRRPRDEGAPMKKRVLPRRTVRWSLALTLLVLGDAAPTEARTTVASNVTNGSGVGQNPFDKASQRKVVRDAAGACYVVFTQTHCYGAGCPGTPTYQNREVVIARSLDCDTSWQHFLLLTSSVSGTEYLYPSIDLSDDRQTLHVVAYSTNPGGVLYTQNASPSGTGWSTADSWKRPGDIDPTPGAVDYDTIATTLSGAPRGRGRRPRRAAPRRLRRCRRLEPPQRLPHALRRRVDLAREPQPGHHRGAGEPPDGPRPEHRRGERLPPRPVQGRQPPRRRLADH